MVNLIFDDLSEEKEDSGEVIRINANFDEGNQNARGTPLADYQADENLGHRIIPNDSDLKDGLLSIKGESSKGNWKLIFPEKIKIWRKSNEGEYTELTSKQLSDEVKVPFSGELKIEGIKGSQVTNDVKIVAEFVPTASKKAYQDSVFLTVLETKFALTFDDGPLPEKTEKIVIALKNFYYDGEPVKSAFFEIGNQIHKFSNLTRMVDQNGHLVGNHTYYHERYGHTMLSADEIKDDIQLCEIEIRQALSKEPIKIIRNRSLKKDLKFEAEAEKLGYKICSGEILRDWDSSATVEEIKERAKQILEKWNTRENPILHPYPAILIFHDFPDVTYDHINEIVSYLQDQGFILVNFDSDQIY